MLQKVVRAVVLILLIAAIGKQAAQGQAPLLGLTQPGTKYSSALLGTSPSLTVFNGAIYLAFKGDYSDNSLWLTYSTSSGAFTNPGKNFKNIVMLPGTAPAITSWNSKLWLSYTGSDGYVYLVSSADGLTFSSPVVARQCTGCQLITSNSQPSLAVYNNFLWIAWTNPNGLAYATTGDGSNWVYDKGCDSNIATPLNGTTVGLAVFKQDLYFAYGANKASGWELVVCHTNGLDISNPAGYAITNTYPSLQVGGGISIYADPSYMYLAYKDISTSNYIHVTGTTDAVNFTSTAYSGIRENADSFTAAGTTVFNSSTYYFAYVENSSSHHLWVSTAPYPY